MHPYHWHHWHHGRGRGPSRFIWFVLGGVVTAWWMKHHERRENWHLHARSEWRKIDAVPPPPQPQPEVQAQGTNDYPNPHPHHHAHAGSCPMHQHQRRAEAMGAAQARAAAEHEDQAPQANTWHWEARWGAPTAPVGASSSVAPPPSPTPASPWRFGAATPPMDEARERLEEEKERIREWGRQADSKITEFSEAALDTVLSTVDALKQKLAERRFQREAEAQRAIDLAEEARRNPPRWV